MSVLTLDERRRLTLPKGMIEKGGKTFVAIRTREGILLKSLPDDPLGLLREQGKKLRGRSVKRLRHLAVAEAAKEVRG